MNKVKGITVGTYLKKHLKIPKRKVYLAKKFVTIVK